jgi:hypothetical protein
MNYKIILISLLILVVIIIILKITTRKPIIKTKSMPKLYMNNQGNGTNMVIGGFSSPNHLYSMNMVPYNGPL